MTDAPGRIDAVRVLTRLNRLLETVDSGLTIPQYRVLMALSHGGIRSAMLAERLAVRRPTLTAIADGLVAAGYAVRESEPGDRRVVQLQVTDAGRAALRRADQAYVAKLGPLFDEIAGDRFVADLIAIGDVLDDRLRRKIAVPVRPGRRRPPHERPPGRPRTPRPAAGCAASSAPACATAAGDSRVRRVAGGHGGHGARAAGAANDHRRRDRVAPACARAAGRRS